MSIIIGQEILFYKWNSQTEVHDGYPALVRSVIAGEENIPDVNLSYFNGSASINQNQVHHEEFWDYTSELVGNDFYKENLIEQNIANSIPFSSTRPDSNGRIVWYVRYDSNDNEEYYHPAVVVAILGSPSNPSPNINLFYIDNNGDRITVSNVDGYDSLSQPIIGQSYWANRILLLGEIELFSE